MEDLVISEIKTLLAKAIDRQSKSLNSGGATSYEDYKYKVGLMKGYSHAIEIVDEALKGYIDNN